MLQNKVTMTELDILVGSVAFIALVIYYLTATYGFWRDRGVPYAKPQLLFGNIKKPILRQLSTIDNHKNIYNQFKNEKFVGYFAFRVPILMIRDPSLIESILVKDFDHFLDRGLLPADPENEPLTMNLFLAQGQKWRSLRYKLTPTFTSGKLKGMFDQMYNCGEDLVRVLKIHAESGNAIEAKKVVSFFTTDVIASCAFGLQLKAESPEGATFREMVSQVFTPTTKQLLKLNFRVVFPKLAKLFGFKAFGEDMSKFFINLIKDTIQYRLKNRVQRNDFVQLLMNLRKQEDSEKITTETIENDLLINQLQYTATDKIKFRKEKLFSDECIAAQTFVFLLAGSDTTAGALSFILLAIAQHPEIQKLVQRELDEVISSKGWCYETMRELTYLDQVIQEGMRMYPIAAFVSRDCTERYQLPGSSVVLDKGQRVMIPVPALHMDPQHYPQHEVFRPERFRGNNYRPSPTYLPFGHGPRICIAMRFAVLEMKICLARILTSFSISLDEKTQLPIQYDPQFIIPNASGGIWLNFHKRLSETNL